MKTILTRFPNEAAEVIRNGGIVAFPTETVYGLGANIFDEKAIASIFEAKRRPADNPLIAHIADLGQIGLIATEITESGEKFIENFFPGPLTIVLPKAETVPLIATAGLDTIGIRMPRFKIARAFLAACKTPVVAPSANLSGRPSPTTWESVFEDLDGRIDCILQAEATEIGLESTVVDCTADVPLVLRSGSISVERLRDVVAATAIYETVETEIPRSPGLRHRHYSPRAEVIIVNKTADLNYESGAAYVGMERPTAKFDHELICHSAEIYAHSIFEFFRECDRLGIKTIYCGYVPERGIGIALMDRIRRAAAN